MNQDQLMDGEGKLAVDSRQLAVGRWIRLWEQNRIFKFTFFNLTFSMETRRRKAVTAPRILISPNLQNSIRPTHDIPLPRVEKFSIAAPLPRYSAESLQWDSVALSKKNTSLANHNPCSIALRMPQRIFL